MAWYNVSLNLKKELYNIRTVQGTQRQPSFAKDITDLNSVVERFNKCAFDEINQEIRKSLCNTCKYYEIGGHWLEGQFDKYSTFYRVENLDSFIVKHKNLFTNLFDNTRSYCINPNIQELHEIFKVLVKAYQSENDWLDLSNLVNEYFSYRGFSWWTNDFHYNESTMMPKYFEGKNLSFENKWLVDFSFQVGISSDWLSEYMLFLKFEAKDISNTHIKVPSIIDAYSQPIFSPQEETKHPSNGLVFNLNEDPKPTFREYIITNIYAQNIKFIPVRITLSDLDTINPYARINDRLIKKLISYV